MKPLYTTKQFETTKSRGILPFECEKCHTTFYVIKNEVQKHLSRKQRGIRCSAFRFCSKGCMANGEKYPCKKCGILVYRTPSDFRKGKKDVFCSQRCAAIYTQKDGGHCHWSDEDKKRLKEQAKNNPKFVPGWNRGKQYASTITLKCRVCNKDFIQVVSKMCSNKTQTCGKDCRRKIQSVDMISQYKNGKLVYGGTTKWLKYKDIKVQGSYEYRTCIILDKWLESKKIQNWEYTNDRFGYIGIDGKNHNYLMDFKVWNNDGTFYYIEIKGYQKENDKLKWKSVQENGYKLEVWFEKEIKQNEFMATVA